MSDDTSAPKPPQTRPYEHYCQFPGCTKWGGFGYARGKGEYDWFCYEHRPEARDGRLD
jgi:hypothetical protein